MRKGTRWESRPSVPTWVTGPAFDLNPAHPPNRPCGAPTGIPGPFLPSGSHPRTSGSHSRTSGGRPLLSGDDPGTSGDHPRTSGDGPMPSGTHPMPSGGRPLPSGDDPRTSGTRPRPSGHDPRPSGTEPPPSAWTAHSRARATGTTPAQDADGARRLHRPVNFPATTSLELGRRGLGAAQWSPGSLVLLDRPRSRCTAIVASPRNRAGERYAICALQTNERQV